MLLIGRAIKYNAKMHIVVIPLIIAVFYSSALLCAYVMASPGGINGITYPVNNTSTNSTIANMFYQFEGRVYIIGQSVGSGFYVYAPTGGGGTITPKFTVVMIANQHCYYQIKLDNQTVDQGDFDFWKEVPLQTQYSTADIEITLKNITGVALPRFTFDRVSIWNPGGGGGTTGGNGANNEGTVNPIIKPYIEMTQGQWNMYILARLIIDITLTILGYLAGSSLAVIKCDYQGVQQVL